MKFKIINFVSFQTGWFLTCFGAANALPNVGVLFTLVWLVVHLLSVGPHWSNDLIVVLIAAFAGYSLDSILVLRGILEFPAAAQIGQPSTLWMVGLWVNLALIIRHSLGWLRNKFILASVLGAISGPLAYFAGHRIGCLTLSQPLGISITAVAIEWLIAMPLLIYVVRIVELRNDNKVRVSATLQQQKSGG